MQNIECKQTIHQINKNIKQLIDKMLANCRQDLLVLCFCGLRSDLKRPREKYLSSAAITQNVLIHAKQQNVKQRKLTKVTNKIHKS